MEESKEEKFIQEIIYVFEGEEIDRYSIMSPKMRRHIFESKELKNEN